MFSYPHLVRFPDDNASGEQKVHPEGSAGAATLQKKCTLYIVSK